MSLYKISNKLHGLVDVGTLGENMRDSPKQQKYQNLILKK
jgi:hypothetical protein